MTRRRNDGSRRGCRQQLHAGGASDKCRPRIVGCSTDISTFGNEERGRRVGGE